MPEALARGRTLAKAPDPPLTVVRDQLSVVLFVMTCYQGKKCSERRNTAYGVELLMSGVRAGGMNLTIVRNQIIKSEPQLEVRERTEQRKTLLRGCQAPS